VKLDHFLVSRSPSRKEEHSRKYTAPGQEIFLFDVLGSYFNVELSAAGKPLSTTLKHQKHLEETLWSSERGSLHLHVASTR